MDLNKAMIIGRLTRDPEARTTPQGITVCNFSVATSRVWKDQQGNQQEKPEYHNIVAWRRLADICSQYLSKGRQVYIEGYLQTRTWDGQDGKKNYRTEIIADNMIMLGNRGDSPAASQANTVSQATSRSESPSPKNAEPQPQMAAVGADHNPTDEEIRIEDIPF